MNFYHTIYQSTDRSSLPQFQMRGNDIFSTIHNKTEGSHVLPWYQMRGNKLYSTLANPNSHFPLPMYEVRGNHVYTTIHNPDHNPMPAFQIRK